MQTMVINTWFSEKLIHGIARAFILFMFSYIFQIFIVHRNFFQIKLYILCSTPHEQFRKAWLIFLKQTPAGSGQCSPPSPLGEGGDNSESQAADSTLTHYSLCPGALGAMRCLPSSLIYVEQASSSSFKEGLFFYNSLFDIAFFYFYRALYFSHVIFSYPHRRGKKSIRVSGASAFHKGNSKQSFLPGS